MTEREPVDLTHLPALLAQAQAEPDWRRRCEFIRPFVAAMLGAKLWLAERDALLAHASEVFRCSASSLLIDMRRARVEQAAHEQQAELDNLERLWGLE